MGSVDVKHHVYFAFLLAHNSRAALVKYWGGRPGSLIVRTVSVDVRQHWNRTHKTKMPPSSTQLIEWKSTPSHKVRPGLHSLQGLFANDQTFHRRACLQSTKPFTEGFACNRPSLSPKGLLANDQNFTKGLAWKPPNRSPKGLLANNQTFQFACKLPNDQIFRRRACLQTIKTFAKGLACKLANDQTFHRRALLKRPNLSAKGSLKNDQTFQQKIRLKTTRPFSKGLARKRPNNQTFCQKACLQMTKPFTKGLA